MIHIELTTIHDSSSIPDFEETSYAKQTRVEPDLPRNMPVEETTMEPDVTAPPQLEIPQNPRRQTNIDRREETFRQGQFWHADLDKQI